MISLSYIFVFLSILVVLSDVFSLSAENFRNYIRSFKSKLQVSMISMFIFSLILTGVIILYLNIYQNKATQVRQANEKMNSVLIELQNRFGDYDRITPDLIPYVSGVLSRISGVFFTDVNLYDNDGILIASSREEIFNNNLIGRSMNTDAFYPLKYNSGRNFSHEESVGKLDYLSTYTVLLNNKNKVLGFINLPYFTKQEALSEQISSIVVALINIYVLLILLSLFLAIFLSNMVSRPLRIVQEKIARIKIDGKNEQIEWKHKDEIGQLIIDYNRMVVELEENAKKLAESERKSAWHTMAKQIAHEIKNPLTPIKLNIQLLNRAWDNKDEDFGKRLENVTKTLIEQIDTLATTASEFAEFASTTQINLQNVDLLDKLNTSINLFSGEERIKFEYDFPDKVFYVRADNEKIVRVFNNIIKNAVQAIPTDKEGLIKIAYSNDENFITISITDNGIGIPVDLRDKLFEPSFTTKSGGMGLGLGISKGIIENFNGSIWFESKLGEGTTFFIKLPLF